MAYHIPTIPRANPDIIATPYNMVSHQGNTMPITTIAVNAKHPTAHTHQSTRGRNTITAIIRTFF